MPKKRLEGCIEYAQEICEDAGKLSLPQVPTRSKSYDDSALLLRDNNPEVCCEINSEPSSHR